MYNNSRGKFTKTSFYTLYRLIDERIEFDY